MSLGSGIDRKNLVGKNLYELPALLLGDGLGLDDADFVAYCGFVIFIVGVEFLGSFDDLLETWVWHTVGVFNDDGFIHGCGDYEANAGLTDTSWLSV